MADPNGYEEIFRGRLRREGVPPADGRLAALEQRIDELTVELSRRDADLARSHSELEGLKQAADAHERRSATEQIMRRRAEAKLEIVVAERDAALREVGRRAAAANELSARIPELERELDDRDRELRRVERELDEHELDLGDVSDELGEREADIATLESEVATLESEVDEGKRALEAAAVRARRTASQYGDRVRELEQLVSTLAGGLAQTKDDIDRAAGSRAWRWGHGATRTLRRLALKKNVTEGSLARARKRIEQIQGADRIRPSASAPSAAEPPVTPRALDDRSEAERAVARTELAAEIRARLGPPPERESWPAVSIVVPTRNGLGHIERLVAGLEQRTDYPEFELVVVDNQSTDGTREFLADAAVGFPIEVIANEEPTSFSRSNGQGVERARHRLILFLNNDIEPFETGWLRELVAIHDRDGIAAVGAMLLHSIAVDDPATRDRTVQHRSIKFRATSDGVRAYNSADGEDLFESGFGIEDRGPAVTAACTLVERDRFDAVGGFAEGYRFGTEDVDLGLKLSTEGERVVATGRSILYHRESATQDDEGRDFKRNNRLVNRRLFLERWGPLVRRNYRLGRLRQDPNWTDGRGPHVAITVTSLDIADGWGDWYTAHEIGDALTAIGWRVTYVQRKGDDWYRLPSDLDYVLALMDPFDLRHVPDEVTTIVWVRNWTERWLEQPWFDRADVILVSSGRSEELIKTATGRHTVRFPLATNPARFAPLPSDPELAADYVFTGNHWGKDRDIQAGLEPRPGERLAIYGKGWQEVPEMKPHARGSAPYERLPAIYSSAKVVLDDTSGPTLPYGAVNSRVFDALAAGTPVITNCESGARELFGDDFPTWTSPETLRARLDELLGDEERRVSLGRRLRAEVLRRHTYAHRARQLVETMVAYEERLSFCLKIGAPTWEEAERWGDLHFARAIQHELRGRGHRCLVQVLGEWENDEALTYDVVVVIRGLSRHYPKPGQFNVLWNISHPDDVSGEECDGYDLVCVASEKFAATLREMTSTPVVVLEQATDPSLFYPDPSPQYEHDLVYVANSRNVLRPIVRDLLPTNLDLAIYGANWEGLIDTRHVVAEHVPNHELRKVYSSAKIVLCDHWDDMREHGFVSNRIYDALACGATIVSDEVAGLENRFGPSVRVYRSPADLHKLLEERNGAPSDPAMVPPGNTFADRVDVLLNHVTSIKRSEGQPARAGIAPRSA